MGRQLPRSENSDRMKYASRALSSVGASKPSAFVLSKAYHIVREVGTINRKRNSPKANRAQTRPLLTKKNRLVKNRLVLGGVIRSHASIET